MSKTHRIACGSASQGLHEITTAVKGVVSEFGPQDGLCTLYIPHTSASLTIQENADPAVLRDLENWLNRLVPEDDPLYEHTAEGPDDMPAHIKAALTSTSLSIPVLEGQLALGTWQGIFLWEHRHARNDRQILIHLA
jgi:secondary thiamine-phosphate synthase enzyme